MRTRSSSNLPVESPPNPSTSNLRHRNRRRSKRPFILKESPIDTMADQRQHVGGLKKNPRILFSLRRILSQNASMNSFPSQEQQISLFSNNFKKPPPASVKSVEEICVICGGAHLYYQYLTADGNTFPELRDNIQEYVNYNQGNFIYRPPEETLTDQDLAEYTIKVPPPLVQKFKPPSQRNFVVHQRDPLHPNIPYSSRMYKQKQQEKDEKMVKALLSNKEKLQELANTSLNENHSAVILKKLYEKLLDTRKFLIPCGFNELKCKALADLEIEYLLYHDSILKDSIDQSNLADPNDNLIDTMPGMFTYEHALDYSSPPLYDEYDDDLFEVESDTEYFYNDPFDSKGEKIKDTKLLINKLDLPCDFLLSFEYDSFLSEDFSKIDALPSTNNEDKPAISHASSFLEDFDPPLYELSFFKEVPRYIPGFRRLMLKDFILYSSFPQLQLGIMSEKFTTYKYE
nr:reverse transcriptase domain-containing protein [Tanacetum cinerariifolium]